MERHPQEHGKKIKLGSWVIEDRLPKDHHCDADIGACWDQGVVDPEVYDACETCPHKDPEVMQAVSLVPPEMGHVNKILLLADKGCLDPSTLTVRDLELVRIKASADQFARDFKKRVDDLAQERNKEVEKRNTSVAAAKNRRKAVQGA